MAPAEPLSPELALVCPELRRAALERLPDVRLDALGARSPAPPATPARRGAPSLLAPTEVAFEAPFALALAACMTVEASRIFLVGLVPIVAAFALLSVLLG